MNAWHLPDQFSDVLPVEAARLERLRRRLLDLFSGYGYDQVIPPLVEYAESLRVTGSEDLDRRSFKMSDPVTGRLLGIRADMTPQVARIDAHQLGRDGVVRLSYAASVVHAQAAGLLSSREPLQLGCELYGHAGLEADLEIQELALACLDAAGLQEVHLDLTDRGIFLALMQADPGLAEVEEAVLAALALKDRPRLMDAARGLKASTRSACEALLGLYGPATGPNNVIDRARSVLPPIAQIKEALDRLERVATSALFVQHPRCALTVDLADLAGWRYHNGIMFSISSKAWPDAIVRGGRYDGVGEAFGRARAATGFSLELRALASLVDSADADSNKTASTVAAPWRDEVPLREAIASLRGQGRRVVCLPEGELSQWTGPRLKPSGSGWVLAEKS